jgi:hypothetical protein
MLSSEEFIDNSIEQHSKNVIKTLLVMTTLFEVNSYQKLKNLKDSSNHLALR